MARREEIDKILSTSGGKKIIEFRFFIDTYQSIDDLFAIYTHLAAGDWVFFISSGNKE